MSVFNNVIGQRSVIEELSRDRIASNHAWLFTGPPGSGRSTLAIAFAASIVCTKKGCGTCIDCRTSILGNHPDVELFIPQGVTIKVDEVREMVSRAAWRPSLAPYRVTVIEDCDRMSESASNALLKAIEEPGSQNIWLLCAPSIEDVLPTIKSRCQIVSLKTPSSKDISNYLQNSLSIDGKISKIAAAISQGHIGRARFYATNSEILSLRNRILHLFLSVRNESLAMSVASELYNLALARSKTILQEQDQREEDLLRATVQSSSRGLLSGGAKALKDLEKFQKSRGSRAVKDELDTYFLWLQSLLRDSLLPPVASSHMLINPDLTELRATVFASFKRCQLERIFRKIQACRESLQSTNSQLLTIEAFCLGLVTSQNGKEHPSS